MIRLLILLIFLLSACELPVEAPPVAAGVPSMPPPPCWDDAGNPLPDDVCAARAGLSAPENVPLEPDTEDGKLPGPPEMPD